MGEIVLAFVKCSNCKDIFPIEVKEEGDIMVDALEKIPKYCPWCGSTNLDFTELSGEYMG